MLLNFLKCTYCRKRILNTNCDKFANFIESNPPLNVVKILIDADVVSLREIDIFYYNLANKTLTQV